MGLVPIIIIIPTHGRPELLEKTLDSVANCVLPESYQELVVIENGSRDGADSLVRRLPDELNARYMHRDRGNKSYALNEALQTIERGLVVFFDDDVRVERDALMAYAEKAKGYDRGVIFGGSVDVDYERPPPEWLVPSLPLSAKGYVVSDNGEEFYLGFNWAAFACDIKELGGFDPQFGPGSKSGATGQETDMQRRLLKAGCASVGVPNAQVSHYVPRARSNMCRVLERSYKKGIHKGIKKRISSVRIIKSIASFAVYTLKSLALGELKNVCVGVSNISQQVGILKGVSLGE